MIRFSVVLVLWSLLFQFFRYNVKGGKSMGVALPEACLPEETEGLMPKFPSVGFAHDFSTEKLESQLVEIVKGISKQLNDIALRLINSSNGEEFNAIRKKAFPDYYRFSVALSNIMRTRLDDVETVHLARQALGNTHDVFVSEGQLYLGDEAQKEVLFCISTQLSAYRWLPRLACTKPSDAEQDKELARKFSLATSWFHFHLDCLELAIHSKTPINEVVLQELLAGIRLSVMAYAHARTALDLRGTLDSRYTEELKATWDEEDQFLANAD